MDGLSARSTAWAELGMFNQVVLMPQPSKRSRSHFLKPRDALDAEREVSNCWRALNS